MFVGHYVYRFCFSIFLTFNLYISSISFAFLFSLFPYFFGLFLLLLLFSFCFPSLFSVYFHWHFTSRPIAELAVFIYCFSHPIPSRITWLFIMLSHLFILVGCSSPRLGVWRPRPGVSRPEPGVSSPRPVVSRGRPTTSITHQCVLAALCWGHDVALSWNACVQLVVVMIIVTAIKSHHKDSRRILLMK